MAACVRACVRGAWEQRASNSFFFLFISPAKGRIFIQHLLLNIIISNGHRLSDFTTKERGEQQINRAIFCSVETWWSPSNECLSCQILQVGARRTTCWAAAGSHVKTFSTIDKCIFCKSQFLSAARMYVIVAAGMRLPNKQFQTYQCCTWISRKVRLIPACIQKTSEAPRFGKQRRNLSLSPSPALPLHLSPQLWTEHILTLDNKLRRCNHKDHLHWWSGALWFSVWFTVKLVM